MEDCPDLCTPSEPVRGSAEPSEPHIPVAIIGAGPAGLTAAYELARRGIPCVVLEELGKVGGLARTEAQNGFLFDIGGHRFYSKVAAVKQFWHDMLGVDFLCRARQSRIYSNGQYYQYPLRPWEALTKLGVIESLRCIISYLATKFRSRQPAVTLEDWLVSSFGRRLYERFFRTYTEKVWGRPCRELSAEWAAQRIQGMSLAGALKDALGLGGRAKDGYKSLIKEFHYPRRGPGMLWEEVRRRAEAGGAQVVTDARVDRIQWAEGSLRAVRAGGRWYRAEHFLSTMPIRDLIGALDP
ncbi:MAG: FAD-dependent oxidoreductase, partial [Acidobacteria bacterium]|nr:FAD-dependent oxidoreductase [Acidobacteriota bacterium]